MIAAAAAAVLCVVPPAAHAATEPVAATTPEVDDPAKFFLFYMDGVSTNVARADLVYCVGQAKGILSLRDRTGGGGGLLVELINARSAEIDRFRMRNAAMRKCMGLYGYARYKVPQTEWKTLVKEGDIVLDNKGAVDPEVIDRMAAFASGAKPSGERLDP
jgi:hypothetical protein